MKITNCEIYQNQNEETIIKLLLDEKYEYCINNSTLEFTFDGYTGDFDFKFEQEDLELIKNDANSFFLNRREFQNWDFGGNGLSLCIPNGTKKQYNILALKYDCYLGQCWNGMDYDYILFLQLDYDTN